MPHPLDEYASRHPLDGHTHGFVDEAGDRSGRPGSSRYFVMAGVLAFDRDVLQMSDLLARLRTDTGRLPHHLLKFRNLSHDQKLQVTSAIGASRSLFVTAVLADTRTLAGAGYLSDPAAAYLYTLRFLLERMSWAAKAARRPLIYTLGHIRHFRLERLRAYEARLRAMSTNECQVKWPSVVGGGRIDTPENLEPLQLADCVASSIWRAVDAHPGQVPDPAYLQNLAPRLYRGSTGRIEVYGLKFHPDASRAAYPWVAAL